MLTMYASALRAQPGPPRIGAGAGLSSAIRTEQWKSDLVEHFWTGWYRDGRTLHDDLQRERGDMQVVLRGLGLLSASVAVQKSPPFLAAKSEMRISEPKPH